ncbi:HNH endonuclease signature motif containing protein [Streptomyces sp. NPDC051320]|uniref:HNH endonuclease signature motif containing protein n=1 Tax=Streptomyces sp. NPDC051320 TaxID=3154644 RepID=UPI00341FCF7D
MATTPDIARRTALGRSGTQWLAVQAAVFAEETHCWICRAWVNPDLPGSTHPMARTVDHVNPLWLGGEPLERANCRLAHRRCNTIRGNQMRAKARPRPCYTVPASAL